MDLGVLELDAVAVHSEDVLPGDGMVLLRQHLAGYRPLVTATALGGAAAVFDTVTTNLTTRQSIGDLPRLRDSALVTIGRVHSQLVTALLGAVAASHLADTGYQQAEFWSAAMKAHGIDTANLIRRCRPVARSPHPSRYDSHKTSIRTLTCVL